MRSLNNRLPEILPPCPLEAPAQESWMQRVAAEMNLSETAFFWPEGDGFRLRWFPIGQGAFVRAVTELKGAIA